MAAGRRTEEGAPPEPGRRTLGAAVAGGTGAALEPGVRRAGAGREENRSRA